MNKILIGICGTKGSGKDTIASILCGEPRFQRIAFADKLKEVCMDVFGLSHTQVHGSIRDKETVDPRWGVTPRHILQQIGTEGFRSVHKEVWVRHALARVAASEHDRWVIPDVRFPDEAEAIRAQGGFIWKVERPGIATGVNEAHASETEIANIRASALLDNSGTLAELEQNVAWCLSSLSAKMTLQTPNPKKDAPHGQ